MQLTSPLRIGVWMLAASIAALCLYAQTPAAPVNEAKGMPPRSAPTDYQAQAKAGAVTIAAEFSGHSVATPEAVYTTEDYVVVEAAFYGPPEARLKISPEDFSLRINEKKTASHSVPAEVVLKTLKDPNWIPPEQPEAKSKSSFGGNPNQDNTPPVPPKMPMELQHVMHQHVQKATILSGDRALPQAGLLFFTYRGKPQGIHTIELIYSGPAGEAELTLQP